ncbi:MAG: hypothetical protein ABIT23_02465 [Nitrosospira sp.]
MESAPGGTAAEEVADGAVKEGILSKVLLPVGAGVEAAPTEGTLIAGAVIEGAATDGSVIEGNAGGGMLSDREVAEPGPKVGGS